MTWLSGADNEVLAAFPGDRAKFAALGAVMMATGVLASISMWFFLHMALRLNGVAAVPLGLLWGAGIISIDRMLVVSMGGRGMRAVLLQGIPRLLLALLLGFIISTPVTLQIFSPEINNQIKVIQHRNSAAFAAQVNEGIAQQSAASQQPTTGNGKLLSLQQDVTSAQSRARASQTARGAGQAAADGRLQRVALRDLRRSNVHADPARERSSGPAG
jgi:hypothetical protein